MQILGPKFQHQPMYITDSLEQATTISFTFSMSMVNQKSLIQLEIVGHRGSPLPLNMVIIPALLLGEIHSL